MREGFVYLVDNDTRAHSDCEPLWYLSTLDGDPDGLTLVLGLDDLLL